MDDFIGRVVHMVGQLPQQYKVPLVRIGNVCPRSPWTWYAGIAGRDGKHGPFRHSPGWLKPPFYALPV